MSGNGRFAVTVYAGSRTRARAEHLSLAAELGSAIAKRGWVLVYGGSNVGLMGACADAALRAGGRVEGVILDSFSRVAHQGLHDLDVVGDMRSRKAGLARRGDAFVALPGGLGTLEELFEVWTWRQLGYHDRPIALLNTGGYYDLLLDFLLHSTAQQFVSQAQTDLLIVERDPAVLLERIAEALPAARTGQAPDLSRS